MNVLNQDERILRTLPADFHWGTATAAYQIEGAAEEDGRGRSIWDVFAETPGKIHNGDTGRVAVDHYHRYAEDFKLMKDLGIEHYRFSLAWPRLLPTGSGESNQKGIEFYDRLVDALLENGITPLVTLYHWDLPQALQDKGGWQSRETAYRFQEYADLAARQYGDRVQDWVTLNEPWCSAVLGHLTGEHAPGLQDPAVAARAGHHLLLAHGLAVQTLRERDDHARVGIALNLTTVYPARAGTADEQAVALHDAFANRWFLDPVFRGSYPDELLELFPTLHDEGHTDDLSIIRQPLDFLGINYYQPLVLQYDASAAFLPGKNVTPMDRVTDMGWPVMPIGLKDLLIRLSKDYGPCPIIVSENGAAFQDVVVDGQVHDVERTRYIAEHIGAMAEAIQAGVDVRGYYVWSFIDNFEWSYGYAKRFGIVHTDYETLQRTPKDSALWYADLIHAYGELHRF